MLNIEELEKRIQKLRKSLRGIPKDPTLEEVHDLRTRTRRAESILQALELNSSSKEKNLLSDLKRIRSRAGKVRDMDVLMSRLLGLENSSESDCTILLAHHLGADRHRNARKLHSAVSQYGPELRRQLKNSRKKLDRALTKFQQKNTDLDAGSAGGKPEAPLHAAAVALGISSELAAVPRLGARNLHAFRIEAKRLRYVLEMADTHRQQGKLLDALRDVQDSIGEWHDWLELHTIAEDTLRHDNCKLIARIAQIEREKLQTGLQLAEQVRQRYLKRSPILIINGKKRPKPAAVLSTSVLAAASKIAA